MSHEGLALTQAAQESVELERTASPEQIVRQVRAEAARQRLPAIMALGGLVLRAGPLDGGTLALLRQVLLSDGDSDCRWQAAIVIGLHIETRAEEVWQITAAAGCSEDADVRAAVATCLLEHLIEHDRRYLDRAQQLASRDARFRETLASSWHDGPDQDCSREEMR